MSTRTRKGYQKHRKRHHRRQRSHKLSDHFSKRDFKCKHCDEIKDCKKTFKLSLGLIGALELLRTLTKNRINILKGYECLESNEKRKIFKKNYHTMGLAVVITIDNMDPTEVFQEAETIEEIKGLGLNLDDNTVYIDTRKENEAVKWVIKNNVEHELNEKNRDLYLGSNRDTND